MVTVWEYSPGDVFFSMLWFFLFFIWIWLLISVFSDIFRSDDLSGWGKALWTIFVIVLPYLGVFVYLIVRGKQMGMHAVNDAARREQEMRSYVQSVAGTGTSPAAEIERLAELHKSGAISEAEFQQAKAKLLA
ncbi:MAG TPA: SHOCT domain-containing protein [Nocardioides sp.]|uniref:SHOCT domain-containing protein n=1 Tax=Nocardioides sp. TaxID=35761 RepID=UPI002E366C94|nr:SHOCT domain-containing protein [Nocardioides sp.]HEX5086300.1 SHOCT domain-containing protein [Nocardioides sp.]